MDTGRAHLLVQVGRPFVAYHRSGGIRGLLGWDRSSLLVTVRRTSKAHVSPRSPEDMRRWALVYSDELSQSTEGRPQFRLFSCTDDGRTVFGLSAGCTGERVTIGEVCVPLVFTRDASGAPDPPMLGTMCAPILGVPQVMASAPVVISIVHATDQGSTAVV